MPTRRMFLMALAGTAAVLGAGVRMPAAFAASGVDPAAVAALDGARQPTQWGMSLPGIVTTFAPSGRQLALTATEFKLLAVLMERVGRVQSRDRLLADVWGYENAIESRTVDIYITRLRGKLGRSAGHLETVRGFGYRLVETPSK